MQCLDLNLAEPLKVSHTLVCFQWIAKMMLSIGRCSSPALEFHTLNMPLELLGTTFNKFIAS